MHSVTSRMWIFGLLILSSFHDGLFIFHGLWIRWYRGIMWSESPQLCPTLCDPMDFTVHEIFQARILEWVAYPFSRRSSWPRNWTGVSCITGGFFTSWAIREAQIKMWWQPVSDEPCLTFSFHLLDTRILLLLQIHFGKSLPDCFLEPRCLSFLFAPHI